MLRKLALVLSLLGLSAGCNGGTDDDEGSGTNPGESSDIGLPTLANRYRLELTSIVGTRNKTTGEQKSHRTSATGIVTAAQDGAKVNLSLQPCTVTLPTINNQQPRLSDGLIPSLGSIEIKAELTPDDAGVISLTSTTGAIVIGAQLALTDPVPTDEDDAFDQDGDGNPGVTISVPLLGSIDIEVFVAARLRFALSARVDDPSQLSGQSNAELESEVLGDGSFAVNVKKMVAEARANLETVSQDHRFTLTADPAATGCP
jgi:hypothetical protein